MKDKIKILLGDPRHGTIGAHSNYVPIAIGYAATYLKKKLNDTELDIELSVDPDEIFKKIENWKPDILALSNYIWNSGLSYRLCEHAKQINSNTVCVLGGPEIPAGTGAIRIEDNKKNKSKSKTFKYLKERKDVDFYTYCDGEVAFLEIVKEFIKEKCNLSKIKNSNTAVLGCLSLSKDQSELLVGGYIPRIGTKGSVKSRGRDVIPSPYLSGLLDKFLNGKYIPAFETARGCPFLCTFCDQGIDETKITAFSAERLTEEFEYVAKKVSSIKGGTKSTSIFDSNWGIFQKDVDLGSKIAKIMNKYDWPQHIETCTPKKNQENLFKINDMLKNRVGLSISMQSMNDETLGEIKRKNWTVDKYMHFIKELQKRGKDSQCELIIPLPGETKESYLKSAEFLMDNNIKIGTYTLMMLCGAELGRDEAREKYNMLPKWRLLPKQFGEYKKKKIFEVEEICVGTNTMSYKDYLKCRQFSFIACLLPNKVLTPFHKIIDKLDITMFDFALALIKNLEKPENNGKFKKIYNDFKKESEKELFRSKEEAINFYQKKENYSKLLFGEVGENLLGKYIALSLLSINDLFDAVFHTLINEFKNKMEEDFNYVIEDSKKYVKNLYMIGDMFNNRKNDDQKINTIKLNFDFPAWLNNTELNFNQFKKQTNYKFYNDLQNLNFLRNQINVLSGGKKIQNYIPFGRFLMQFPSSTPLFYKKIERI